MNDIEEDHVHRINKTCRKSQYPKRKPNLEDGKGETGGGGEGKDTHGLRIKTRKIGLYIISKRRTGKHKSWFSPLPLPHFIYFCFYPLFLFDLVMGTPRQPLPGAGDGHHWGGVGGDSLPGNLLGSQGRQ